MNNFCINCGAKIRKEDKFCTNCGTKIIRDDNFCSNCGAKIRKEDKFCTNCGTKIYKSDINQNNHFKSSPSTIEKNKAKKELKRVVGGKLLYNKSFINKLYINGLDTINTGKSIRQQVEKEIDAGQIKSEEVESRVNQLILEYKNKKEEKKNEENKKLRMVDEAFESEEIKSELRKNKIDQTNAIKDNIKNKLINNRVAMNEGEIKYFIKAEVEKAIEEQKRARVLKEKEMRSEKIKESVIIKESERTKGGYCDFRCRHYYEEYFDSGGGIIGDFDGGGYTEDNCYLGHSIVFGRFCKDYE